MYLKRLDLKYYFVVIISYALLLTLAIGCIFIHSDRAYRQLDFYRASYYRYMYELAGGVGENDYMHCRSVFFYTDGAATAPIHGDRLMMMESSEYSGSPFGDCPTLGEREVAVSANLAVAHGLSVGSTVYSEHNIRGGVAEYTVAAILPVCYGVTRVELGMDYGVILMGYDSDYHDNTDYTYLVFFRDMPTSSAGLIDLVAKETQAAPILNRLILWQSVISLLVAGITVLYAALHMRYQRRYYARLRLCGGTPLYIRRRLFADLVIPGAIGLLAAAWISILIASLGNGYFSYRAALFAFADGFAALMIASLVIIFKGRKA